MLQKKILLVGDFGVGKSSLVERFVHGRFSEQYKSTIGVVISKKEIEVAGQSLRFLIWDVAGSREIAQVPASYYLGCAGLLYVFDLSRPETWSGMAQRIAVVRDLSKADNLLIVGNKSDLCSSQQLEQVLTDVGVNVDCITSARDDLQVDQAFEQLGKRILHA